MLFPPLVNLWLRGAGRGISTETPHFIQAPEVRALGVSIIQAPPDPVSLNWTALNTPWLGCLVVGVDCWKYVLLQH